MSQDEVGTFRVIVPHGKKELAYPMRGHPLYTKRQAVAVMEAFGRKCPRRIEDGHALEVWADGPGCRFTLQDWRDDNYGVRTEGQLPVQFTESPAIIVEVRQR